MVAVGPWQRSRDLKNVILLHERLPEPRGQEFVQVREFVEGEFHEHTLRRLAYKHHRTGAIDGDNLGDAPLQCCFTVARTKRFVGQTVSPGTLTPHATVWSSVDEGRD